MAKEIDNSISKLYVLCSDILNPTYATVQGSHAVAQYIIDNVSKLSFWNNDTIVFLYYPHDKLQDIVKDRVFLDSKLGFTVSVWKEPDLNNACTAIAYWNQDLKDTAKFLKPNERYIADIAQSVLDSLPVVSNRAYEENAVYISSIYVIKSYPSDGITKLVVIGKNCKVFSILLDRPFEEYHFYEIKDELELNNSIHFEEDNFYDKMENAKIIVDNDE